MTTPANQVYVYHYNAVGSTIAMTDINKNIVNAYQYDPFGNIANQSETISQPFKFVGQFGVMTEANGFYYMRARYYDPNVGRFISEDPIGFAGGDTNLMAYVGNNPIMLIDPLGLKETGANIVDVANKWLGVPYDLGGDSRKGIDCSHLVQKVYQEATLPYTYAPTSSFAASPSFQKVNSPQEGDVILFKAHMGIYTNGEIISAQSGAGKVMQGEINWFGPVKGYYRYKR